jgi:uncharacterized protein involved in type VI secretion and phage assembly
MNNRMLESPITRQTERYQGKYRGIVTDNQDPKKLGRLKARVPEVLIDVESGWALPCAPYAGEGVGVYLVPPPAAGVWIEFEAGDVSRPIWSGCWWGEGQVPRDQTGSDTDPDLKILRSGEGLLVALHDGDQTIAVSDSEGRNLMLIEVGSGKITIQATAKVVIDAAQIEFVANATHPLVFGDDLLTYLNQLVQLFNTHVHAGEMAGGFIPVTPVPPVAPFPPATPGLLSAKVKTG